MENISLTHKIGFIFIGIYCLTIVISYISIIINTMTINEVLKERKISNGNWHGGTFYAKPPLLLDHFSDNLEIIRAIKLHNKAVKTFWGSFIFFLIGVIILNK